MLSDFLASAACACVFELPTKGSWGFASERGAAKESRAVQAWMTSGSGEKEWQQEEQEAEDSEADGALFLSPLLFPLLPLGHFNSVGLLFSLESHC